VIGMGTRLDQDRYLSEASELSALKMVVVGIGGCGNNTINNLKRYGITVPTVAVNTDAAVLAKTRADYKILIGESKLRGRGSAGSPELGRRVAEEDMDRILAPLRDKELIILVAGLGGGTGTGGLPAIAEAIEERYKDKLTIAVVTLPFTSEGPMRAANAQWGLAQTLDVCDMVLVYANDILRERTGNLPISQAFREMDKLLVDVITGIVNLQSVVPQPGLVNIDFSNLARMIEDTGLGYAGVGRGRRVYAAYRDALDKNFCEADLKGGKAALILVEGSQASLLISELEKIPKEISEEFGIRAIFWGVKPNWRLYEPKALLIVSGVKSPLVERWLEGV